MKQGSFFNWEKVVRHAKTYIKTIYCWIWVLMYTEVSKPIRLRISGKIYLWYATSRDQSWTPTFALIRQNEMFMQNNTLLLRKRWEGWVTNKVERDRERQREREREREREHSREAVGSQWEKLQSLSECSVEKTFCVVTVKENAVN